MMSLWTACLKWFGNLPIKSKLYISFGWMCLFTLVLGTFSLGGIHYIAISAQAGQSAEGEAGYIQLMILGLLAFILFVDIVMAWRLAHLIGDPVVHASQVLDRLANRDLTVSAAVESSDEVGQMCSGLNRTVQDIHAIMTQLVKDADALESVAEDIAVQAAKGSENCQRQSQLAQHVTDSTGIVADKEQSVMHNSHESVTASREASQAADAGRQVMASAVKTMEEVAESSAKIGDLMHRLDARSSEIGKVVVTIREISESTHLLGLNASIEAARAGQQGRGFAVVASEVQELAKHTRAATEEIASMIKAIQEETASTVKAIEASRANIQEGRSRTDVAYRMLTQIIEHTTQSASLAEATSTAVAEQSLTSREIASSAAEVASLATGSLHCSTELANSMQDIRSSARRLGQIVHQFTI